MYNTTISLVGKIGLGNPNKIHVLANQAFHDLTSRPQIKKSTHVNSVQERYKDSIFALALFQVGIQFDLTLILITRKERYTYS